MREERGEGERGRRGEKERQERVGGRESEITEWGKREREREGRESKKIGEEAREVGRECERESVRERGKAERGGRQTGDRLHSAAPDWVEQGLIHLESP